MASRVQGGAAARPWWHNPDLDMPVEDIATFYREHTQKLSRLQKQKEKEKKKDVKRKQRKQRKRERGEDTSSSSSGSSSRNGYYIIKKFYDVIFIIIKNYYVISRNINKHDVIS